MKVSKADLYKLDAVEIYKLVLKGDVIKTFPKGFWMRPDAYDNASKCVRYLLEVILKYSRQEILENNNQSLYKKNKLGGMLAICFNNSPYQAIDCAYKGRFKEWEFKIVPMGYWTKENGVKATRWLIKEKLKLSKEELKEQLSNKLFYDNGLGGMLNHCFNNSPYLAIESTFPGVFKVWEFKNVPMGYWTKENGVKATRWLIDEKLKLSKEEVKKQLSANLFKENSLESMLTYCFKSSPYLAIESAYPGVFKEWEFSKVRNNFWTKEKGIEATRWLIEQKLKLTADELRVVLSSKLFEDNGLGGMLQICYGGSPYLAIEKVYPGVFKEWEFSRVSNNFWTEAKGIEATKWLIEQKLKLTTDALRDVLSVKLFDDNGLRGMLYLCFNDSPYLAIDCAYPGVFKRSDFKNYR